MPVLMEAPPCSEIQAVTEILHGVAITDPYRWLEDQDSPRTREWIAVQTQYARAYLDSIPSRDGIRKRIRALLDVETHDSLQKVGSRYFFRKRRPGQEQPCIYMREGLDGKDQVLIDPAERGTGPYTAVKLLRISPHGQLLLYEVKQGGERSGSFELFDVENRRPLRDKLARGFLRGFAFSPDSRAFYYVHEPLTSSSRTAYRHVLGTNFAEDVRVFHAGEDERSRLSIVSGTEQLGFFLVRFNDRTSIDFYLWPIESTQAPETVIRNADYKFGPVPMNSGRILAITDRSAPNFRIVEVCRNSASQWEFRDIVPESDSPIQNWAVIANHIFVSYFRKLQSEIKIFDFSGKEIGDVPVLKRDTIRFLPNSNAEDELFFERESFTRPVETCSFSLSKSQVTLWTRRTVPVDRNEFDQKQVWFRSKDDTEIPMFLVGRRELIQGGPHPTIMTSYGAYGVSMTPQFSVFVAFMMERGCLFALPNIRGGSEFGMEWHDAAKRRKRQVAIDDFLGAAEWLIESGRADPTRFAIFGGSNSGLLVGAAMTQRPQLFRAVVCMVPMLDMLRYHLFDNAHVWKEEFGTAEDPDDFAALFGYSPYHNLRDRTPYPATMIVSGDSDQNCNALHARKMVARLQTANISEYPIFLDYYPLRGHSPVLPVSKRIDALTDRMAFLCDQLGLVE